MPELNAWIGARYAECGRILILLESTYGEPGARQDSDVVAWGAGGVDRTFEAIHRSCATKSDARLDFFNSLACINLVPDAIGPTNDRKVTDAQLRTGAATLLERLRELRPRVVWIASARARKYAVPVVEAFGARIVVSNHPSRARSSVLRAAWEDCRAISGRLVA